MSAKVVKGQLWHQFVSPGVMRHVRVLSDPDENGMVEVAIWVPGREDLRKTQPCHTASFVGLRLVEES